MPFPSRNLYLPAPPATVLVLAAAFALSGPADAAPPQRQQCDQQDSGARIKCKFGNIIEQQQASVEMISFMPGFPQSQKDALVEQVNRNRRAQGRSAEEDFKTLAKKAHPKCQVLEITGDGIGDDDGVCKGNEECVEVAGDQIGNDDGVCKPRNGKNRETCVEICDQEGLNSDPDNFDDDPNQDSQGRDVERHLDEVTNQYIELNEMLEEDLQVRAAARILTENGDPCAQVFAARHNINFVAFTLGFAETMQAGHNVLENFCRQDVLGNNVSAPCAVSAGIAGIARVTLAVLQFDDGNVNSDTIDGTYACLQSLNTSAGETNQSLDAIQTKLNTLEQMMNSLQNEVAEVKTLVTTPLGRREGFPAGNGDNRRGN
jgi:hypothetical protein